MSDAGLFLVSMVSSFFVASGLKVTTSAMVRLCDSFRYDEVALQPLDVEMAEIAHEFRANMDDDSPRHYMEELPCSMAW